MAYYNFKDDEGNDYGSFETILITRKNKGEIMDEEGNALPCGWYWVAGFPGCLWDGEPMGPFRSEPAAVRAARDEG